MAGDEFSELFPSWLADYRWPSTYEGKDRTHIRREEVLQNHTPDSRQQMVNFFNDTFYDGGRDGRHYAENITKMLELPLDLGHGIYDTTRATAEGRLGDAAISLAMVVPPPPLRKAAKEVKQTFKDIIYKRTSTGSKPKPESPLEHPNAATESENTGRNIAPKTLKSTTPVIIRPDSGLVVPKPHVILPDTGLVVPNPHVIRPVGRDVQEAKRDDGFKPTFSPYPPPQKESEIEFTLPRHWKQRSSPWVAQYPPLTMRPRPFRLDYPKDPPTNAQGRVAFDIEGRPLTARIVVGRNEPGKRDRAVTSSEMVNIIQDDLGLALVSQPKDYFQPGTIGHLSIDPKDGRLAEIAVWNQLPADQEEVTIAHELGHVFELIAKQLSSRGLNDELVPLYSAHTTGRIGPPYLLAENRGYAPHKAPHERAAEAFRIYSTGPNTMKSMAPKTAAAIRELNPHPFFSRVIQFNGVPFGMPAGAALGTAAAIGAMADSDDANAAPSRQTSQASHRGGPEKKNADRGLASITNALSRRVKHVPSRQEETFRDLVQTVMQLKHNPRIHRYGGPR